MSEPLWNPSEAEFDRCWPWLLASLCEFGPTHTKEQVFARIRKEQAFLWPGGKCAIVGEFINHPIGFRSFNYWLQGGNLRQLKALHPHVEAWAELYCQRIMGMGRDGWVRAM